MNSWYCEILYHYFPTTNSWSDVKLFGWEGTRLTFDIDQKSNLDRIRSGDIILYFVPKHIWFTFLSVLYRSYDVCVYLMYSYNQYTNRNFFFFKTLDLQIIKMMNFWITRRPIRKHASLSLADLLIKYLVFSFMMRRIYLFSFCQIKQYLINVSILNFEW